MNLSRNREWRRFQRDRLMTKRCGRTFQDSLSAEPVEQSGFFSKEKGIPMYAEPRSWQASKDWKLLYLRSTKLARARQLKMFYPRKFWTAAIEDALLSPVLPTESLDVEQDL